MMYFEDFEVGQTFSSPTIKVTAEAVKAFATEFDPQPFHTDEAAAGNSVFGRLAASGWHTAAMTMRMIVNSDMKVSGGQVGLGGEIRWPRATYPGDELHVVSDIIAVTPSRSNPAVGIVTVKYVTTNQDDDAVQIATMKLRVPRR
jgi:acyl dehydratase